jgi:hypothetical protein
MIVLVWASEIPEVKKTSTLARVRTSTKKTVRVRLVIDIIMFLLG